MSSSRRKLLLNTVTVDIGCSCRKPRLSNIFHPKPKHEPSTFRKATLYHHSSSSSWDKVGGHSPDEEDATTTTTTTTFSPNIDTPLRYSDAESDIRSLRAVQGFGRIGGESVAVEKESDDPYLDFRRSMLQMILEKEIYSKDDLRELLNCFLQLNSPYHHGIIVRAFTEIWNGVFSVRSGSPKLLTGGLIVEKCGPLWMNKSPGVGQNLSLALPSRCTSFGGKILMLGFENYCNQIGEILLV
ncbi:hypothetical protein F0562_017099 [Nyssa sinensis]|uniref:Transcription repressor n=1 Tax=Nyssa sinensis TaxID=561372 RepID=A0A5J4ZHW8_9ASTE|nr:hypothetical protein F0562_017099 [Nyssa sinensis]